MRTADSGRVSVCGINPETSGNEFKKQIGAVLQSTALPEKIHVKETWTFSHISTTNAPTWTVCWSAFNSHRKEGFVLQGAFGRPEAERLALAMALVNNPKVVFLDEPTAGLDPEVRREIYGIIEELRRDKKTVLITTHYIEKPKSCAIA